MARRFFFLRHIAYCRVISTCLLGFSGERITYTEGHNVGNCNTQCIIYTVAIPGENYWKSTIIISVQSTLASMQSIPPGIFLKSDFFETESEHFQHFNFRLTFKYEQHDILD